MKIKRNKNLLGAGIVLIVCLVAVGFSASIRGDEKCYRIRPDITLPEYRTDTARTVDVYERVMDRLMDLFEKDFSAMDYDVKDIAKKLVSIDSKLSELSARMARIEESLNISQPEIPAAETPDANKPSSVVRN